MFWRRRKAIVCRRAVELVTDYLEGTLSERDRRRLEEHLAGCPNCSEYLAQMRKTIETMGRVAPESLDPAARDDLVALYRQWRS